MTVEAPPGLGIVQVIGSPGWQAPSGQVAVCPPLREPRLMDATLTGKVSTTTMGFVVIRSGRVTVTFTIVSWLVVGAMIEPGAWMLSATEG